MYVLSLFLEYIRYLISHNEGIPMYGGSTEVGGTQKEENGYKIDPVLFLFRSRGLSVNLGNYPD
jgi:hypothetical protein